MDAAPIRVGVVGPRDSVEKILEMQGLFPSLILEARPYGSEVEAPDIAQDLEGEVDLLLFSGPIPFHLAKSQLGEPMPMFFISYAGTTLYRSFFMLQKMPAVKKISIDTIEDKLIRETLEDLDFSLEKVNVLPSDLGFDKATIVSFHQELFSQKASDMALTCLRSAYMELEASGIPAIRITMTKSAIIASLEKLMFFGQSIRNKDNHIVVGIASVDQFEEVAAQMGSEHQVQRIKLELQKVILRFVEEIDGYLISGGGDEHIFITTRLLLNNVSKSLTEISLIERIKDKLPVTVGLGIGIGETANQAGSHARLALFKAKEQGGNCGFVVSEDKRLIGPLRGGGTINYRMRSVDPQVTTLAEKSGISVNQFEKIIGAIRSLPQKEFTANDLVSMLNISIRSVRRLIKRLLEANILVVVGKEKVFERGLHRRVYALNPHQEIRV